MLVFGHYKGTRKFVGSVVRLELKFHPQDTLFDEQKGAQGEERQLDCILASI
jgi:hypothetical protein